MDLFKLRHVEKAHGDLLVAQAEETVLSVYGGNLSKKFYDFTVGCGFSPNRRTPSGGLPRFPFPVGHETMVLQL